MEQKAHLEPKCDDGDECCPFLPFPRLALGVDGASDAKIIVTDAAALYRDP